jgi:hypothetical protein
VVGWNRCEPSRDQPLLATAARLDAVELVVAQRLLSLLGLYALALAAVDVRSQIAFHGADVERGDRSLALALLVRFGEEEDRRCWTA